MEWGTVGTFGPSEIIIEIGHVDSGRARSLEGREGR